MMVIGVAGLLASGKTIVAKKLVKLSQGVYINADEVAHELYEPGQEGWKRVRANFGEEFLKDGGAVDRRKLGEYVFARPEKLKLLNRLIHPLVKAEIERRIRSLPRGGVVIVEAFSFEKGVLGDLVDKLVFVDAPRERIYENAAKERGLSRAKVDRILKSQGRAGKSDYRLKNDGDVKQLKKRVEDLWKRGLK